MYIRITVPLLCILYMCVRTYNYCAIYVYTCIGVVQYTCTCSSFAVQSWLQDSQVGWNLPRDHKICGFVAFFLPHQRKYPNSRVVQHHSKPCSQGMTSQCLLKEEWQYTWGMLCFSTLLVCSSYCTAVSNFFLMVLLHVCVCLSWRISKGDYRAKYTNVLSCCLGGVEIYNNIYMFRAF